jgi:hypothetical protein
MTDDIDNKRRLDQLGIRIEAMARELDIQGVMHGPEREAVVERKLQDLGRKAASGHNRNARSEAATDFEILILTLERFLARIEKGF